MKKTYKILLLLTLILAILSISALVIVNQAYKIDFQWYSQFDNKYKNESRDLLSDDWKLSSYPNETELTVINNEESFKEYTKNHRNYKKYLNKENLKDSIYICCSFGSVYSIDYRIKVKNIIQRGNVVEIKISANSPEKALDSFDDRKTEDGELKAYYPKDIILIKKEAFFSRGILWFIIKDQDGMVLYRMNHEI